MDKDIKQDNEQRREDQKQEEQKKNTSNQNSNQSEPLKKRKIFLTAPMSQWALQVVVSGKTLIESGGIGKKLAYY